MQRDVRLNLCTPKQFYWYGILHYYLNLTKFLVGVSKKMLYIICFINNADFSIMFE